MSTIGPKIILEGEKEYRKAIADVNSSMRVLKSELKAVSAEFDGNANSVEALRKKNEILTKQQAEQEKAVKLLRGALESVTKEFGENSRQAQQWQTRLNNAQAQLSRLNKELGDNDKHLKEAERATDKTAKSIDEFGKEVKEATEQTSVFGDVLKANLLSDAVFDGIKKLGSLMIDMIKDSKDLASDLLEVQNVVDVTFGNNADEIDDWANKLDDAFGLSELRGKEFAGTLGAMMKSANIVGDELIETTQKIVERTGDLASYYNSDLPNAFTKARSLITGESEPLKQWGINMTVANLEAYALAEGLGKLYSEMEQGEQIMTRVNYFLKATADAQGDFTRNIESQANQERIMQLQREEMLKQFGEAVLPAVTRATMKLNEAMKEMDGDLTKVAGVIADDIVDALVWIIDNSDKVIAGLKGIVTAMAFKKAGDGLLYVVNAYKTLTAATQAATTAQAAFNTVSKANIYVALASAIYGVAIAVDSYVGSAKKAADETAKMDEETKKLIDSSKQLTKEIRDRVGAWEDEKRSVETNYGAAKVLSDKLYDLADKEQKTNAEKKEMISLVEQLNNLIPNLNLTINEQTGLLSKQKQEMSELIEKYKDYAMTRAAEDKYVESIKDRIEAETQLNYLVQKRAEIEEAINYKSMEADLTRYMELWGKSYFSMTKEEREFVKTHKNIVDEWSRANQKILPFAEQIRDLEGELENLAYTTEKMDEFISELFSKDPSASGNFASKYQKYLDEQTQAEIGTLEDRQKKISRIYEETSKELDKQLRAEERAFAKSQQKRVEEVQKAQQSELKELEKAQKVKLDLLNEEYLEKIRVVDEDRYKELKKIQDEIDSIDAQQEAEDRALQAREEAEKRAELQARVENAKTIEERMEAQKDLQRHDERVARDRLKAERGLQKDVLKEQKETINKGYDEKIKTIQAEQKAEQEKLAEQYSNEKEAIAERYKLKLENLKEEQELEKEALRERQTEYKEYLREQKELAIANSKAIYEEDLAKFKLNQALKYEETVSSEAQMKKAIQEYAYKNMQPGNARDSILRTNDLSEMLKYYNPSSAIKSSVPQTTSMDYGAIEEAMTRAVKKLNLSVVVDNKVLGKIVDEGINRNLRR